MDGHSLPTLGDAIFDAGTAAREILWHASQQRLDLDGSVAGSGSGFVAPAPGNA